MTNDQRKLVLVVDADQSFIDAARALLPNQIVLTARDLDEAREIVLGGRVDVVVLGAAFASEHAVADAVILKEADPTIAIVLAADVVTNRLLKAALRAGFADVVDLPLTTSALSGLVGASSVTVDAGEEREISVLMEPADPASTAEDRVAESVPLARQEQPQSSPTILPVPPKLRATPERSVADESRPPVDDVTVDPTSASSRSEFAPEDEWIPTRDSSETAPPSAPGPVPGPGQGRELDPDRAVATWPEVPPGTEPARGGDQEPAVMPPDQSAVASPPPAPPRAPEAPPEQTPPTGLLADRAPVAAPAAPPRPQSAPPTPPPLPPVPPTSDRSDHDSGASSAVDRRGRGRVIAVMAGKGGSGKTVVATNLAIAMGLLSDPERVAIVDADLQFGDVALMLQVDPIRTIDDVIGQLDSMTDARLEAALLRHESGLRVLPAPLLPVRTGEISAKSVVQVVDRLRHLYDTIIVDTGPVFDDGLITILENADAVVSVVDMDLPSVKNGKVALDALRQTGFPMERITLVVNRVNSKARLDLVELERSLGLRIGGSVPSDRLVPQSVNEGVPLLALSPRSKVARSFMALAERLGPSSDRQALRRAGR